MKENKKVQVIHTRRQKIFGCLALLALFGCGFMVGMGIKGRSVPVAQPGQVNVQEVNAEPKETCQIVEDLLLARLEPVESQEPASHEYNISVYEKLIMNGCSENQMKYHNMAQRERKIMAALSESGPVVEETCEQIEALLLEQMPVANGYSDSRIIRAKIYANLSERGCAGNSAKYVELAKQELEIARALEDDRFDNDETIEVVETYKRLNMQAAAEEIFETAKKLTNPAIDFILEVEKIINEQ